MAQIVLVSRHYPRKIARRVEERLGASAASDGRGSGLRAYRTANLLVVVVGLALLAAFFVLPAFEVITTKLAVLGAYFVLQLVPLAMSATRPAFEPTSAKPSAEGDTTARIRLFDVVSPASLAIALILLLAYVTVALSQWDGEMDTQLLKVGIFAFTHIFFAATGMWVWRFLATHTTNTGDRLQQLRRQLSVFVYLSIGISLYYFGKQLLFDLDLPLLRPVMMSGFMQMLAALTLEAQLRR